MLFFAHAYPGIVTFCCIPHGSNIVTVATARALAEFTLRESAWGGGVQLVLNLQMAVVSVNTYSSVFLTFLQTAMRSVKRGRPRPQCLEFTDGYAICKKGWPRARCPHTRRAVSQNLQLEVHTRPRVRQNLQIQNRCLARRGEFKQVSDVKSRCSKC